MDPDGDRLALVIGGASGIGAALVDVYRSQGAPVVTWDIAGEPDVRCDVSEPEAIDRALDETRRHWGIPEWITITVGVGHGGLLLDVTTEEFDRVLAVNTRGPWLCLRGWARVLKEESRSGSLMAVSSVSARLADRTMGIYCASKAALSMLVRVAADEWGPDGLRVNAVAPGVTRTPMLGRPELSVDASPWLAAVAERTSLGRLGEPEDIAPVILAVHNMEWVTGQVVECDGGLSLRSPIDPYGEALRDRTKHGITKPS
jgi:NAD(P)-dependent dehydrogenase (short-subunit alcohol dehydrogenase family)